MSVEDAMVNVLYGLTHDSIVSGKVFLLSLRKIRLSVMVLVSILLASQIMAVFLIQHVFHLIMHISFRCYMYIRIS